MDLVERGSGRFDFSLFSFSLPRTFFLFCSLFQFSFAFSSFRLVLAFRLCFSPSQSLLYTRSLFCSRSSSSSLCSFTSEKCK